MGKEIIKPVVEALVEGMKDDKRITPEDLERHEVARAVRQIKALWNPDMKETPAVLEDRNDVLHTILMTAVGFNIDHQEIADWIYGHGKVNVESMLSKLWSDETATYADFSDAPFPMKKLEFRATPQHLIDAKFFKGPSSGKLLVQINVYRRPEPDSIWYGRSDFKPEAFISPQEVDSFDEAMKMVEAKIQELRKKEHYMVTRLTEGGDYEGGGRGKKGALDVNPRTIREDEGEKEIEIDYSKLAEKLRNSKDKAWVINQLEKARDLDVSSLLLNAALKNNNLRWENKELMELINWFLDKTESLKQIIDKSNNPNAFIDYLAQNLPSLWIFEGRIVRKNFDSLLSRLPAKYKSYFLKRFRHYRQTGRYHGRIESDMKTY